MWAFLLVNMSTLKCDTWLFILLGMFFLAMALILTVMVALTALGMILHLVGQSPENAKVLLDVFFKAG